ncbi:MAG: PIG-L family deacetylase [Opitutus sp.]
MSLLFRQGPRRLADALAFLSSSIAGVVAFGLMPAHLSASEPLTAGAIVQEMRNFRELGSVLYVAAHPDDENNRLLPYLARGRALRTGYLAMTRGDGGQNLIGTELGAQLGVIRTQELLAARRIDGAQQFFTRARDFGFSKDSADTLQRWDRQQVLADIVRVVRTFRPDVMVARFSPIPGGTHGHHTASAILAIEAFKAAGDPNAFPEQLKELSPWQPKRIFWNGFVRPGENGEGTKDSVRLDAGGFDPLLGESFGEIGARGRSMHKSQGEGRTGTRGPGWENFDVLAGAPANKDLFDGIDTTWSRIPGGAEIGPLADDLLARYNPQNPAASVPALLAIRAKLNALAPDPLLAEKRAQLDRVLQACLGLFVETVIPQAQVVPGEALKIRHTAVARTGVPVRWLAVRYPSIKQELSGNVLALANNEIATRESAQTLPAATPPSQPYWLRAEGTEGMFEVADASLIGRPENPPVFAVEQVFEVGGQTLVIQDEPVQVITDPVRGELRRRLDVIPPVSLSWPQALELFAPGATKSVVVEVTAARAGVTGNVEVNVPAEWAVQPAAQPFKLAATGERARFEFKVTAPSHPATAQLTATADLAGARYRASREEIRYDHIPTQLLQAPAQLKVVSLELAIRGRAVGYLPGAGDLVAESLTRMGYAVTPLGAGDMTPEKLSRFDAIVVGVRAFNTRADLEPMMPALFAYAEQGGNLIVQYNTANGLRSTRFAPYSIELSGDRVTNAKAPVELLAKDHPALNTPNKITSSDFDGWLQERARYVPRRWDNHFIPLLASGDPGEKPLTGTLLVAQHGKGYVVYSGLSWFRELPAGVPGAYRLFANLVSLGK